MNYTADLTARLVIDHSFDLGKPVTHLCLQKILYYIQAVALVETGPHDINGEVRHFGISRLQS